MTYHIAMNNEKEKNLFSKGFNNHVLKAMQTEDSFELEEPSNLKMPIKSEIEIAQELGLLDNSPIQNALDLTKEAYLNQSNEPNIQEIKQNLNNSTNIFGQDE
jgi:hypothetical protein